MKRMKPILIAIVMIAAFSSGGCAQVKEYQKNKINDGEMQLNAKRAEKQESNFQTYREGASGANGGKVGGGCGCN